MPNWATRVNVRLTISGIYRDGFGDKVALLDKAARLAAAAGDNAISRHDRTVAAALVAQGTDPDTAGKLARARVFAAKPGNYAIGVQQMVEQSRDAQDGPDALARQYLALHELRLFGRRLGRQRAGCAGEPSGLRTRPCCSRAPARCTARWTTTIPTSTPAA